MTYVWIVLYDDHGDTVVAGVYADGQKALEAVYGVKGQSSLDYSIEVHEVNDNA